MNQLIEHQIDLLCCASPQYNGGEFSFVFCVFLFVFVLAFVFEIDYYPENNVLVSLGHA